MISEIIEEDLEMITASSSVPWDALRHKTVLISGANGMLASYLVFTFLRLNDLRGRKFLKVVAVCRNRQRAQERFRPFLKRKDFQLIINDLSEPFRFHEPLDFIIHAAGQASPKYYGVDPVGTLDVNVVGTRHLLNLANVKKVKSFLFFSTSEVYGTYAGTAGLKETDYGVVDPMNVRSCYVESKRLGETMCVSWHHQFGVPTKIVRPFHTYGPTMRLDDGRVYADFVSNIVRGKNIVLHSDGSARRAFCYISDAVVGFLLILLKGRNAEAYNLGNPQAQTSMLNLAQQLVALVPEKRLSVEVKPSSHKQGYLKSPFKNLFPNIEKLKRLGWRPSVSIEQGFRRTIDHFLAS